MKTMKWMAVALLMAGIIACNNKRDVEPVEYSFEFTSDTEGWTGDFADYPVGEAESYELEFEHTTLPAPLDETEAALRLSGLNKSDDLFMFIKRKISGLEPNTTYYATFYVEFASNVPDGLAGVGGSPGESVFVKAGATQTEPDTEEDKMNYHRMNIDKGNQSQGGADMVVVGDFSNDTDSDEYTLKTVTNENRFTVTTDANGELWLIAGTDSGFEATTTIYYNKFWVVFE
jgi:hypothetical protein